MILNDAKDCAQRWYGRESWVISSRQFLHTLPVPHHAAERALTLPAFTT
jgi:hypothetical protein